MALSQRAQQLTTMVGHKQIMSDSLDGRAWYFGVSAADKVYIDPDVVQELIDAGSLTAVRTFTYYELDDASKLQVQADQLQARINQLQAELDQLTPMKAQVDAQVSVMKAGVSQEVSLGGG